MSRLQNKITIASVAFIVLIVLPTGTGDPILRPDIGDTVGYLSNCPGVFKNAVISPKMAELLQVIVHQWTPAGSIRRGLQVPTAAKMIAKDKTIDFKNKKTLMYFPGYLESSIYGTTLPAVNHYSKRGYNVFVAETLSFFTFIYPKSARLARPVGKKYGELLANLTKIGLKAEDLEIIGMSLGTHVSGHAAKRFYALTGKKPFKITALDPAGPCFRAVAPENRLDSSDATNVVVVHTNIDGFGIAERLGHVDFYVNGGEYQFNDIKYLPCLLFCSHVKVLVYFWVALDNPKMFIGVKCDSIDDARKAKCFGNTETNYIGETRFDRPGIYYVSTDNVYPYYRGKDGIKSDFTYSTLVEVNSDDVLVV